MPVDISSSTYFTFFLGSVSTSLSFATACMLSASTSSSVDTHVLPVSVYVIRPSLLQFPCLSLQGSSCLIGKMPSVAVHSSGTTWLSILQFVRRQFPSQGTTQLSFQFEHEPSHVGSSQTSSNFPPILTSRILSLPSTLVKSFSIFHVLALLVSFAFVPRTAAASNQPPFWTALRLTLTETFDKG